MAKKLIDRWREDENPAGIAENYEYDKSAYPPVEFVDSRTNKDDNVDEIEEIEESEYVRERRKRLNR